MPWKPDTYPSLSPYLLVVDAQAVLDFAAAVFGATPLRVVRDDAGAIVHAECRIDDSVLMMGQTPDGTACHVHLYLPDPDAAFAKALDHGATAIRAMEEQGDGDRRGGVRDPQGTSWWLSRQL